MATLDEQIEALTRRLDERDRAPLAAEVAEAKGLPAGLAKRLQGSTREELERDADVLIAALAGRTAPPRGGQPKEKLRGGAADQADDDTDDDFDPQKVADAIRRGGSLDEDVEKAVDRIRRGF